MSAKIRLQFYFGLCLLYLLTVTQRRKSSGYGAESGPLTMKGYCDGNGASSCINRQMPHVQHEVPSQLKPSVLAQATQIMNTVFMLPPTCPKGDFSGLELNLVCKCCADHFCQDSIAILFWPVPSLPPDSHPAAKIVRLRRGEWTAHNDGFWDNSWKLLQKVSYHIWVFGVGAGCVCFPLNRMKGLVIGDHHMQWSGEPKSSYQASLCLGHSPHPVAVG